jgi:protein-S-isoprenylcysteine O-methyltransferase Ste14
MTDLLLSYSPSLIIYLIFALTHSLLASQRLKATLFESFPKLKVFYRASYNMISLLFVIAWLWYLPQDSVLYRAPGLLFYLLIGIQIAAVLGLLKSFLDSGGGSFLGLKQIRNYLQNGEFPSYLDEPKRGKLVTKGCYKYMRHPTYTFSILIFLAMPVMTANNLFILICLISYFWVGSIHEERSLLERFGSRYKRYRKSVPKFIPGPVHIYRTLNQYDL